MSLPDFLLIGAPKAGTTALHAALAHHPDLYLSPVKEPKFFLCDGPPPRGVGPGDAHSYREWVWRRDDYERLFDAAPPGPTPLGGGPSHRKNFGSFTGDRYRSGWWASAAWSAVVPAFGAPIRRKSGRDIGLARSPIRHRWGRRTTEGSGGHGVFAISL